MYGEKDILCGARWIMWDSPNYAEAPNYAQNYAHAWSHNSTIPILQYKRQINELWTWSSISGFVVQHPAHMQK